MMGDLMSRAASRAALTVLDGDVRIDPESIEEATSYSSRTANLGGIDRVIMVVFINKYAHDVSRNI